MIVRELEKQERKYALDIIWSVFLPWMWPEVYEQEGIDHISRIFKTGEYRPSSVIAANF